jgi:environmental stress-induced protein Ves
VITILPASTQRRMRWKNGLGFTTELARRPAEGEIEWRVSIAEIEVDAPFSEFPGLDRSLLVLEGAGVRLCVDERESVRRVGDPALSFPGEASVRCALLAGSTRDFNVMTRRGVFDHRLERVDADGVLERAAAPARTWVVHVLAGTLELAAGTLAAGDTACVEDQLSARAHGRLVLVRLDRVG